MEQGLLINCTHDTVIRMLPPFIATKAEVDEAMGTLLTVCHEEAENIFNPLLERAMD